VAYKKKVLLLGLRFGTTAAYVFLKPIKKKAFRGATNGIRGFGNWNQILRSAVKNDPGKAESACLRQHPVMRFQCDEAEYEPFEGSFLLHG
jgi:hypothetical protein